MLNQKNILKDKEIISKLFKKGKKEKSAPVLLLSVNNEFETVLFSVSKKNIPKAVDRNKIKRQMRAIFFNNRHLLNNIKNPKAMAFIYLNNITVEYAVLEKSMNTVLKNTN